MENKNTNEKRKNSWYQSKRRKINRSIGTLSVQCDSVARINFPCRLHIYLFIFEIQLISAWSTQYRNIIYLFTYFGVSVYKKYFFYDNFDENDDEDNSLKIYWRTSKSSKIKDEGVVGKTRKSVCMRSVCRNFTDSILSFF